MSRKRSNNSVVSAAKMHGIGLLSVALLFSLTVHGQMFEDVTSAAGFTRSGERWGASWGDINGDRWIDMFVNNHRDRNSLYRNNGDGTFREVTLEVDRNNSWDLNATRISRDTHGAAWADFDNDGDQDLFISVSGGNPNGNALLMVNQGGHFLDQAVAADVNVDNFSRHGVWFDYNEDGRLDIAHMNNGNIILDRQDPAAALDFDGVNEGSLGLDCDSNHSAMLSDVNNNGTLDFICFPRGGSFPERVYEFSASGFVDITGVVPGTNTVPDVAIGDFDRDLRPDFYLLRGVTRRAQVVQVDSNRIDGWLSTSSFDEMRFDFISNGTIDVDIDIDGDELSRIFIGNSGFNPSGTPFTLNPNTSSHQGINSSSTWGTYIGFNTSTQRWQVVLRADSNARRAYVAIDTSATASDLVVTGIRGIDLPLTPRLMMNLAGGFQEQSSQRGLTQQVACNSAVAADFDNDMDEDIFVACTFGVENLPDRLFLNDGSGNFTEVTGHGAEGATGAGLESGVGASDSVVVADYDNDGFLDLFTTNGILLQPTEAGGPDQLFRNLGNNNNWIKLNLVGDGPSGSNRNGIGAKVFVTAGGVTQLRQQDGGYHRWSQDSQILHFGLAANTTVSSITVEWPSGQTDNFSNLSANNLYDINEGGPINLVNIGPAQGSPTPQSGDECGSPEYERSLDQGVFVWRNCSTGEWMVRASGGGRTSTIRYDGSVVAQQGFNGVSNFSLEGADFVNNNGQVIDFSFNVNNNAEDGFDFFLNAPNGPDNCLSVNGPLFLGVNALPAPNPLNLLTLDACAAAVTMSIDDVSVAEDEGTATFTVSLSDAPGQAVSVNYTTEEQTGGGTVTVFEDDFETDKGWTANPSGTDNATTGEWERANPESTSSGGTPQQLGTTFSGSFDLVTDGDAGSSVGSFDIDNGVTSIRSPDILLPAQGPITLSFAYYLAHLNNSSSSDFLRVHVVGSSTQTVFEELGAGNTDAGSWQTFATNIDSFAGQTVHLLIEAADNGGGSLVEAGIDDVLITGPQSGGNGFATADVDYSTVSGTLNFGPQDLSLTIDVPIFTDGLVEGAETFLVRLSNASVAVVDDTGVGTINDPGTGGTASIGNFVWNDLNADGIQDVTEPGLAGVAINLLDCNGNLQATTSSGVDGAYTLGNLVAGSYVVEFVAPAGFNFSPLRQGNAGGRDSNADPTTGRTHCISMSTGQTRNGIDAGLTTQAPSPSGRIGDFVWQDLNEDGIQDSGEPGFAGVTVNLQDCGGNVLDTTLSGALGDYQFGGLTAGSYVIQFVAPAGFTFSPFRAGPGGRDSNADPTTGLTNCLSLADGQSKLGIDAGLR